MNLKESFLSSYKSLVSNKIRALLTMTGIIIGITSIITISTLGNGVERQIRKDFDRMFNNLITIRVNRSIDDLQSRDYFNANDYNYLTKIDNVESVSISDVSWSQFKIKERRQFMRMQMGIPEFAQMNNYKLFSGRFLTSADSGKKTILIDHLLAIHKYGSIENAIGKIIKINKFNNTTIPYIIVGVFEHPFGKYLRNRMIYLSIQTEKTYGKYIKSDNYSSITFKLSDMSKRSKARVDIIKALEKYKGKKGLFRINDRVAGHVKELTDVLNKIKYFVAAVAALSLFVGGIGVMNIMLVTVTERTREIGIRKAIGAKKRDILLQFLLESSILTIIGGIIGIILGFLSALAIGTAVKVTPYLDIKLTIISIMISIFTGIIFGVMPANRAAKLNPIDALRE